MRNLHSKIPSECPYAGTINITVSETASILKNGKQFPRVGNYRPLSAPHNTRNLAYEEAIAYEVAMLTQLSKLQLKNKQRKGACAEMPYTDTDKQ
jgi:hypothetical protein